MTYILLIFFTSLSFFFLHFYGVFDFCKLKYKNTFTVFGFCVILQSPTPNQDYMKYLPMFSSSTFVILFFKYKVSKLSRILRGGFNLLKTMVYQLLKCTIEYSMLFQPIRNASLIVKFLRISSSISSLFHFIWFWHKYTISHK